MSSLSNAIREKRQTLRDVYGGMMTLSDVARELSSSRDTARVFVRQHGLGQQVGKRVRYETDEIAKVLVQGRGMV